MPRPVGPIFFAGLLAAVVLLSCSTVAGCPASPAAPAPDPVQDAIPDNRGEIPVRQEEDEIAWQEVKASGNVEAVKAWHLAHPRSPRSREAEELWEDLRYAQVKTAGSLAACDLYLREFPAGRYTEAVRRRRERLRFAAVREWPSVETCDLYLREFPNGPHVGEVRAVRIEAGAWEEAKRMDTVREYLRFRRRFAQSGFGRLAEERASPRYWSEAVARNPKSDHALTQLAESCLATAACSLAVVRDSYRRAVALNPNNPWALLGLARLRHEEGDSEGARRLLERSLTLDSKIAETHFYLGLLATLRNDCPAALRHLDRAIALAPDFLAAFFHRGRCTARAQGCRQALPDFRKVVTLGSPADAKYVRQAQDEIRSCR